MTDTFHKNQYPLSEDQKQYVLRIKTEAEVLLSIMDEAIHPNDRSERSRCMNIARTNLEQAVMWAVKGLTTDEHK